MAQKRSKAFVSCSFDKNDKELVDYLCSLVGSLDFEVYLSKEGYPNPAKEKVRTNISNSDCLIAICTQKDKIENSEYLKTSD